MGSEPVNPRFASPYTTPWRVIAVGSLKTVVESTLGTDLAAREVKGVKLLEILARRRGVGQNSVTG